MRMRRMINRRCHLSVCCSSEREFSHSHGIERLPMNLIIGIRSACAASAACRRAFVAANISNCRSVKSRMLIDSQQMRLNAQGF
jgi:hypothetical protein